MPCPHPVPGVPVCVCAAAAGGTRGRGSPPIRHGLSSRGPRLRTAGCCAPPAPHSQAVAPPSRSPGACSLGSPPGSAGALRSQHLGSSRVQAVAALPILPGPSPRLRLTPRHFYRPPPPPHPRIKEGLLRTLECSMWGGESTHICCLCGLRWMLGGSSRANWCSSSPALE